MGNGVGGSGEEREPLTGDPSSTTTSLRLSSDSHTTLSTTSLILEHINPCLDYSGQTIVGKPTQEFEYRDAQDDFERAAFAHSSPTTVSKSTKRLLWVTAVLAVLGWTFALASFLLSGIHKNSFTLSFDHGVVGAGSGKSVTLPQVLERKWSPNHQEMSWIQGVDGQDGMLLEKNQPGKDYLVLEDVHSRKNEDEGKSGKTLMKSANFQVRGKEIFAERVLPSPDLHFVLVLSELKRNWRHSFTAFYWIFDTATQQGQPLDPLHPHDRIQLASWSPKSDNIVFTRDNNMYLRNVASGEVKQITEDGGPELFYGVPDWVYEEEVFHDNSATWWDNEGQFLAFFRTNESSVPEFPVQYFVSRPSGKKPRPGLKQYPEVRQIKYPKAGAPNPIVDLEFYDVDRDEVFSVNISEGYEDSDRLITEVVWTAAHQVLVRENDRVSDRFRLLLIDVKRRTGKVVRAQNVAGLDGGWVELTDTTTFVPADPDNGRSHDGYVEAVIHQNFKHLAYFSPLDSDQPIMLTSGDWEVVDAPSAVDLNNNLVYFQATKRGPTQRHIYSVGLDGNNLAALVPDNDSAYYLASFSTGAGYALLSYEGPDIPKQELISTPSNEEQYKETVEQNNNLASMAAHYELPHEIYQNVTIDGFVLQVVERRPRHFDPARKYPVLFHLYGGPGSQTVDQKFNVDFHSYIASSLGYIVVTVDGRGTGFIGREARCIIRDDIGKYEARDQIETAKIWAAKRYVDAERIAIWGWSYGGFLTLKTLELDAGQTFHYGMAVAPVTDWRFYDSIYTERYMHKPQQNRAGYDSAAIGNMTALSQNVRFLVMHGTADDNVHTQSTLTLLDGLDMAGIENYDVHLFPDSDHSIMFHNAHKMVYDREFVRRFLICPSRHLYFAPRTYYRIFYL